MLADDDSDDCMLFEDALREVNTKIRLTTVRDGIELMDVLDETVPPPPDVIFLDLNMPRKSGYECLEEMKRNDKLKDIPVIIFSTSAQRDAIDKVYTDGANFYIRKPGSFKKLKLAIEQMLAIDWQQIKSQPSRDEFFLSF
jgi:CheY-like chemotaxis protein